MTMHFIKHKTNSIIHIFAFLFLYFVVSYISLFSENNNVRIIQVNQRGSSSSTDQVNKDNRFEEALDDENESMVDDSMLMQNYVQISKPEKKKKVPSQKQNYRSKNKKRHNKPRQRKKGKRSLRIEKERRERKRKEEEEDLRNNYLPRLGNSLSVPELLHSQNNQYSQHQQPEKEMYMSSSFDLARQPFMTSNQYYSDPKSNYSDPHLGQFDPNNHGPNEMWYNDTDALERAGEVKKASLPPARVSTKLPSERKSNADLFNENAERLGKEYRSGKEMLTMLHEERGSGNGRKPYVLPMRIER